jgi:hypothetical protein
VSPPGCGHSFNHRACAGVMHTMPKTTATPNGRRHASAAKNHQSQLYGAKSADRPPLSRAKEASTAWDTGSTRMHPGTWGRVPTMVVVQATGDLPTVIHAIIVADVQRFLDAEQRGVSLRLYRATDGSLWIQLAFISTVPGECGHVQVRQIQRPGLQHVPAAFPHGWPAPRDAAVASTDAAQLQAAAEFVRCASDDLLPPGAGILPGPFFELWQAKLAGQLKSLALECLTSVLVTLHTPGVAAHG